ncbi:hypothetical protein WAI453_007712 [Rhynchosporium graminicola]
MFLECFSDLVHVLQASNMKVSSLLVLITSTITGVAAIALPGVSDNTSLKPRAGELFKREICIIENGGVWQSSERDGEVRVVSLLWVRRTAVRRQVVDVTFCIEATPIRLRTSPDALLSYLV